MITWEKELPLGHFYCFDQKPDFPFAHVHQVHGNIVLSPKESGKEADGLFSDENSPAILGIKTADCLPIVTLGKKGFAHLHAGWRGVFEQIHLAPEVQDIEPWYCFVGPHIQKASFEVSEDFRQNFPNSPELFEFSNDKLTFDLFGQVKKDLLEKWPDMEIQNCGLDTYSDDRFHSYRKDGTAERNWNLFSLKKLDS